MTPAIRMVPVHAERCIGSAHLLVHELLREKVCLGGAQQADHCGEGSYPARGGFIVQLAVHARESRRQGQRGHRVITQQLRGGAKRDVL